jgi:hypothetical protein
MYAIKKINGLWRVVTVSNERIIFSSAVRLNCRDFITEGLGIKIEKPVKQTEEQTT